MTVSLNSKAGRLQLKCATGVRPTKSIVRQALADMLRPWLAGHLCIDLFAGSGAVGMMALAEGAAGCLFVECNRQALRTLRANLLLLQKNNLRQDSCAVKVLAQPVEYFVRHFATTEQVFVWADPPWTDTEWREVLPRCLQVGSGSYLAIAAAQRQVRDKPLACPGWVVQKCKHYGNTAVELLRKE